MRQSPSFRVKGPLDPYSLPFLEAICNSLRIRIIQTWTADAIAALAPLVVYSRVVFIAAIHSNHDGDLFARPAAGAARGVEAGESADDVGVVCLDAAVVVVGAVECEVEVVTL